MARQNRPTAPSDPFVCVVYGRPVSVQTGLNRDRRKSKKYGRWHDEVARQVALAISRASDDRGFAAWEGPVHVRLAWCAPSPATPAEPDLDAVAKPYLDAISGAGRVILEDRQVKDVRVVRYDMNGDLRGIPGAVDAATANAVDADAAFVVIVVRRQGQPDLLPPAERDG